MKFVFAVLFLVVLATSQADEKYTQVCEDETGIKQSEVSEHLLDDDDENDAKATTLLMCVFKKSGAIDDEGHLDVEKAKLSVKEYMKKIDADEDQEAIACVEEKDTIEDTVLAISKCVEKRKAELTTSK